ncbi:hypothetical protein Tco_0445677, partial [Tanacetum coccineum]
YVGRTYVIIQIIFTVRKIRLEDLRFDDKDVDSSHAPVMDSRCVVLLEIAKCVADDSSCCYGLPLAADVDVDALLLMNLAQELRKGISRKSQVSGAAKID